MTIRNKYRVLFIHSSVVPPLSEPEKNPEFHLSDCCEGDTLSRHWGKRSDLPSKPISEIYNMLGSFEYHPIFDGRLPQLARFIKNIISYIYKGLSLSQRKGRYDLIVTYGPYTCLMAALVIRLFTGSKIVVMLPSPPIETFKLVPGHLAKLKYIVASWLVPPMIRAADAVWAYYPTQLDLLPGGGYPPMFVSSNFVPVKMIAQMSKPVTNPTPRYIYFLGHPFDRKGVDLLIKAFNQIAEKHPDVSLKIVGYCPDLTPYRKLAKDSSRVTFQPGIPHVEAMKLMDNCTVFVLPSRMEGVPRVVMEAMACKRPVIASRIHGTPTLIEHGKHGLLHELEDVEGLADCLNRVLGDREFAQQLGEAAHQKILDKFSEERFVKFFREMAAAVTQRPGPDAVMPREANYVEVSV